MQLSKRILLYKMDTFCSQLGQKLRGTYEVHGTVLGRSDHEFEEQSGGFHHSRDSIFSLVKHSHVLETSHTPYLRRHAVRMVSEKCTSAITTCPL